jgi:hypothetical protein
MRFILIQCLLLLNTPLFFAQNLPENAQNTEGPLREKFFTIGIGSSYQTRKDNLFSPLNYSGIGAQLHINGEWISDKWYKRLDTYGGIYDVQSRATDGYNQGAYAFKYNLSYTMARRIRPQKTRFRWYVGGAFAHEADMSFLPGNVNNKFSYNAPTGFSATTYITKDVRFLKRNWILSSRLSIPILVYNARPDNIGFVSVENLTKEYGIMSLNKLLKIDWRWQADLPLSNGNRLRFAYLWSYVDDRHVGRLQSGSNSLLFELMVNIPYRKKPTVTNQ